MKMNLYRVYIYIYIYPEIVGGYFSKWLQRHSVVLGERSSDDLPMQRRGPLGLTELLFSELGPEAAERRAMRRLR